MFMNFSAGSAGGLHQTARHPQPISFYDQGLACACAADDLVEAHKWFNLAAQMGDARGPAARADIAQEMNAGQIAEAQRRARTFLRSH